MRVARQMNPMVLKGGRNVGGRLERRHCRERSAILLSVALVILLLLAGPLPRSVTPVLAQTQSLQEYVLGPGDSVEVTVFGENDLTRTVTIRPDGKINLPLIGDVQAAGLTPSQLSEQVRNGLRTYLKNPQVSVSVREFHIERAYVYLLGQVNRPGQVEIQKGWTVMEVMGAAGGVTPRAALRRAVVIRRGTGQTIPLDLDRLLLRGDRSANVAVEPGDIIMVPTLQNRVLVLGAVSRPGAYDLDEGGRLLDALAQAGGPTDRAQTSNIGVIRSGQDGKPVVTTFDMSKLVKGDGSQNMVLQNADVVYVPEGRVRWTDVLSWLGGLNLLRALFGG